jgi:hypothetical protein
VHGQLTAPADLATLAPPQHVAVDAVDAVGRRDVFVRDLGAHVLLIGAAAKSEAMQMYRSVCAG